MSPALLTALRGYIDARIAEDRAVTGNSGAWSHEDATERDAHHAAGKAWSAVEAAAAAATGTVSGPVEELVPPGWPESEAPAPDAAPPAGTLQARQWAWVQDTFPGETFEGVLDHLKEEIAELDARPSDPGELADVFLLVQCLASHFGVDLMAAAEAKFEECRSREWELVPGKGYRHVKKPVVPDALAGGKCATCGVSFTPETPEYMHGQCQSCYEIPF